jgi:hypothetical protein
MPPCHMGDSYHQIASSFVSMSKRAFSSFSCFKTKSRIAKLLASPSYCSSSTPEPNIFNVGYPLYRFCWVLQQTSTAHTHARTHARQNARRPTCMASVAIRTACVVLYPHRISYLFARWAASSFDASKTANAAVEPSCSSNVAACPYTGNSCLQCSHHGAANFTIITAWSLSASAQRTGWQAHAPLLRTQQARTVNATAQAGKQAGRQASRQQAAGRSSLSRSNDLASSTRTPPVWANPTS